MAKAAVAETHEVSADAKAWLDWFETAGVLPEATQAHRDHEAGGADRPGASSHDADKSGIPPSYDRAAEGADGEMGAVGSDADPEVPLARPMELLADAGTPPGAKKVGKGEHNGSAPGGKSKGSGQDAAIRSLMTRLNDKADTYLLTWVTAASQAAQELPGQIPDKTGAYNFGMALAGNLAWASTSLFPEAQVAVAVISFGGSIVGSGTLSKSNPAFPTADINDSLDKGRDVAKNAFKKACPKLAAQIMKKCGPDDADGQNKALWEYLFSGKKVAFDDMSGLLGAARAELKRFSDQVLLF